MRRKKEEDKRVLRSGNGRQESSKRRFGRKKNNTRRGSPIRQPVNRRKKPRRKFSKSLVLVVILVLVAFVIGAGIGVSLSLDDGDSHKVQFKNVTKEMTTNLNETEEVLYDETVDHIDYNENNTDQLDNPYRDTYYN